MDIKLAEALVIKGVIKSGTEVEAYHYAVGLGGVTTVRVVDYFTVVKAQVLNGGAVLFDLSSLRDGAISHAKAEDVLNIDGMEPGRFASVYDIKPDGAAAKVGNRRGRKPKDRSIAIQPSKVETIAANDVDTAIAA